MVDRQRNAWICGRTRRVRARCGNVAARVGAILLYLDIALILLRSASSRSLSPTRSAVSGRYEDDVTAAANLIYFSFTTLTSVGYGDIVPVHPYTRSLANLEAVMASSSRLHFWRAWSRLSCKTGTVSGGSIQG